MLLGWMPPVTARPQTASWGRWLRAVPIASHTLAQVVAQGELVGEMPSVGSLEEYASLSLVQLRNAGTFDWASCHIALLDLQS